MNDKALNFLTEVLGVEGAKALARTANKEPSLGSLLVPRAALSWLAKRDSYEGAVPGVPNSYLQFKKNEASFTGTITLPEINYQFNESRSEHVAAALAVAVGVDLSANSSVRDVTLVRLGKSIDALVDAHKLAKSLHKTIVDHRPYRFEEQKDDKGGLRVHAFEGDTLCGSIWCHNEDGEWKVIESDVKGNHPELKDVLLAHVIKSTGQKFKKDEPAMTAPPKAPLEPQGPTQQTTPGIGNRQKVGQLPRKPKMPTMKVEKSEIDKECAVCGGHQFENNRFKGCMCFRALNKSVHSTVYGDGIVLEFAAGFETAAYSALRKTLKGA